jgi:hypothetical protein
MCPPSYTTRVPTWQRPRWDVTRSDACTSRRRQQPLLSMSALTNATPPELMDDIDGKDASPGASGGCPGLFKAPLCAVSAAHATAAMPLCNLPPPPRPKHYMCRPSVVINPDEGPSKTGCTCRSMSASSDGGRRTSSPTPNISLPPPGWHHSLERVPRRRKRSDKGSTTPWS